MTESLSDRLRVAIRDVPNFPKPGILFRDITTLLLRPELMREALGGLWQPFSGQVDVVAGIESRGFILGATLAVLHDKPFIPLRKPGKLPADAWREAYNLEYGQDALELHKDAIAPGTRVLLIDDLLATGGTAAAAIRLMDHAKATVVGLGFLAELDFLKGRDRLPGHTIVSLVHYAD